MPGRGCGAGGPNDAPCSTTTGCTAVTVASVVALDNDDSQTVISALCRLSPLSPLPSAAPLPSVASPLCRLSPLSPLPSVASPLCRLSPRSGVGSSESGQ